MIRAHDSRWPCVRRAQSKHLLTHFSVWYRIVTRALLAPAFGTLYQNLSSSDCRTAPVQVLAGVPPARRYDKLEAAAARRTRSMDAPAARLSPICSQRHIFVNNTGFRRLCGIDLNQRVVLWQGKASPWITSAGGGPNCMSVLAARFHTLVAAPFIV